MTGELLRIFLDILILGFLGFTIFYAIKLTKSLNSFRQDRKQFEGLINNLDKNIDMSHRAIDELKSTSFQVSRDLQKSISQARELADELQIMTESGERLASRLEGISDNKPRASRAVHAPVREPAPDAFSIQDRDFYEEDDEEFEDQELSPSGNNNFGSQAERELYQALQKKKKTGGFGI